MGGHTLRQSEMPVSEGSSASPSVVESGSRSVALRGRRVLAKSTAARSGRTCRSSRERLLDSPTYEGFPIRPLYTSLDALPEPPLPGRWPLRPRR